MTGLSSHQRAAITKRNRTRNTFLDAVETVFTNSDYQRIQVEQIANHAHLSTPTFYNTFPGKSAWGSAVLDQCLNEVLYQPGAPETESPQTPRVRLLGHLVLLDNVAQPLPGITQALVEERTKAQTPYSELLPRYYNEVTQTVRDGQEQRAFRDDMAAGDISDFALDSLAMAYAIHLDDTTARASIPSLALDGLAARK